MPFSDIEDALRDFSDGKFLIVTDDENRENEGDVILAAEKVTPEAINFMEVHARGMICVPMTCDALDRLRLPLMVERNTERHRTAFSVTVDAETGTTTGISVQDQARTILTLCDPETSPDDLLVPGHVQPLRASPGGVLQRAGHTEATVDLARLAGSQPAGILCEIKNPDGTMARLPQLVEFSRQYGIRMITIADLIAYRARTEKLVKLVAKGSLPTRYGTFTFYAYVSTLDNAPFLALAKGDVKGTDSVLVRVHSSCLTGDIFKSLRCDCGDQLEFAFSKIEQEGTGVLLYIPQEGRGIGLVNKLKAYVLQEHGRDTVEANEELGFPADKRDYGLGAQVLADLGLSKIRVMTNNPSKLVGLEGFGIEIVERVPIAVCPRPENEEYMRAKRDKMGHILDFEAKN